MQAMHNVHTRVAMMLVLLATGLPAQLRAESSVLVLDFGLRDDTLLPNVPQEVARVATLAPWVRRYLRRLGNQVPEAPERQREERQP